MSRSSGRARYVKRIAELYLYKNMTQADIARELGVSRTTVGRYLSELEAAWQRSALMDFAEAKKRQLAKIDQLETEYWSAWKQSLGGEEMPEQSQLHDMDKGKGLEVRNKSGNPRFLQGIQWCIQKRCELLGVDTPRAVTADVDVTFADLVKGVHADHHEG